MADRKSRRLLQQHTSSSSCDTTSINNSQHHRPHNHHSSESSSTTSSSISTAATVDEQQQLFGHSLSTSGRKRKSNNNINNPSAVASTSTNNTDLDCNLFKSSTSLSATSKETVKISERKAKSNAIRALNNKLTSSTSTSSSSSSGSKKASTAFHLFDELHHSNSSTSTSSSDRHRGILQLGHSVNEEEEEESRIGLDEEEEEGSEFATEENEEESEVSQLGGEVGKRPLFKKRSHSSSSTASSSTNTTTFYNTTSSTRVGTRRSSRTLSTSGTANNESTTTAQQQQQPRKKPRLSTHHHHLYPTNTSTTTTSSKSNEKTGACISSKHSSSASTSTNSTASRKSSDKKTEAATTASTQNATKSTDTSTAAAISFKINRKSSKMSQQQQSHQSNTSKGASSSSTTSVTSPAPPGVAAATTSEPTTTAANHELNRLTDLLQSRGLSTQLVNAFGSKVQQFLHRTISASSSTSSVTQPPPPVPAQASTSNTSNSSTGSSSLGGGLGRSGYLITSLQQSADESVKLTALTEMCQLLVMGNEETLAGFPIKQAVPLLLQCMSSSNTTASDLGGGGENYELMNHACRALTYMMDTLPRSTGLVADGISIFLEKLHTIECMDVAEQALTALEILSRRHAKQILKATQAGGVSACLLYLDFFSIVAQRNALKITANCAHAMHDQSEFVHIQSSLPVLAQRLCVGPGGDSSVDKRSVETVCGVFARLVDNFQRYPHILKELASHQVIDNMQHILCSQPPLVSSATLITIMHTLCLMLTNCNELAVQLLEQKTLLATLSHLFVGESVTAAATATSQQISSLVLANRTPPELLELVSLTAELLPRLPRGDSSPLFSIDDAVRKSHVGGGSSLASNPKIHWEWRDTASSGSQWRAYSLQDSMAIEQAYLHVEDECIINNSGRTYIIDFNSLLQINEETGTARPVARRVLVPSTTTINKNDDGGDKDHRLEHLSARPELYAELVQSMFKIVYEVYASAAGPALKHRSLRTLLRMIYYGSRLNSINDDKEPLLHELLRDLPISSQIASMLASYVNGDLKTVVSALQLGEILINQLPEIFTVYFRREGVLYQIDKLIEAYEAAATSTATASSTTSDNNNNKTTTKSQVVKASTSSASTLTAAAGASNPATNASDLVSSNSKRKIRSMTSNALSKTTESSSSSMSTMKPIAASAHSSTSSTAALVYPSATTTAFPFASSTSTVAPPPPVYQQQFSLPNNSSSTTSSQRARRATTSVTTSQSLPPAPSAASTVPQQSGSSSSNKSTQQTVALLEQTQCQQNRDKVKKWILEQAKLFKQRYFSPSQSQSSKSSTSIKSSVLDRLREANDSLILDDDNSETNSVNNLTALNKIFGVLTETDVSSFELIHSGFVVKLASFLTPKSSLATTTTNEDLSVLLVKNEKLTHHLKQVLHVVCGLPVRVNSDDLMMTLSPESVKFSRLVNKLQQCVQQLESFEVRGVYDVPGMSSSSSSSSSGGVGNKNAAIKYFNTHQIKCMLQRHGDQQQEMSSTTTNTVVGGLRQWRSGYVKVDPLALVSAIERYLLMRGIVAASSSSSSTINPISQQQLSVTGTSLGSSTLLTTGLSASLPNTSVNKKSKNDKKTTKGGAAGIKSESIKSAKDSNKSKKSKKKEKKNKKKEESSTSTTKKGTSTSKTSKSLYESLLFGSSSSSSAVATTGAVSSGGTAAFYQDDHEEEDDHFEVMEEDEDDLYHQHDLDDDQEEDEMDLGNEEEEDTFHEEINDEFDDEDDEEEEDDFDEDEDDDDDEEDVAYFGQAASTAASGNSLLFGSTTTSTSVSSSSALMPRLNLLINGHVLPSNMTIYQAIKQFGGSTSVNNNEDHVMSSMSLDSANSSNSLGSIWAKVHLITYKLADDSSSSSNKAKEAESTAKRTTRRGSELNSKQSSTKTTTSTTSNDSMMTSDLNVDISLTHHYTCLVNNRAKFFPTTTSSTTSQSDKSMETIILLSLLNEINRNWHLDYSSLYPIETGCIIGQQEFVNTKLTAKANRQLQDPLVIMTGHLPAWLPVLMRASPFLFPFDTRLLYFVQSRMDRDRALLKLNDLVPEMPGGASGADSTSGGGSAAGGNGSGSGGGHGGHGGSSSGGGASDRLQPKLERKKRTICRYEDLIKQSDAILNEFCVYNTTDNTNTMVSTTTTYKPALLEIQYENEVGTGLGPTLEFYSLVSLELQKCEHDMWRGEKVKLNKALGMNQQEQLFFTPNAGCQGLYPAAVYINNTSSSKSSASRQQQTLINKLKQKFKFMGKLMAKALMDNRVLDIPLSLAFYKWLVAPDTLSSDDLKHVDMSLYRSLESLKDLARKRRRLLLLASDKSTKTINKQMTELEKSVHELELDFTMPGSVFELKKGGKDIRVTLSNLDEYIQLVVEWSLVRGVQFQMDAFKEGFSSVLSLDGLSLFYPEELERLFCGSAYVAWDKKTLMECTRCDHGYSHESKAVEYLFDIMCSFNQEEQRLFLQFVTGSPRLPLGGLRSLTPRLTIVRKTVDITSSTTSTTTTHSSSRSKTKSQTVVALQPHKPTPDDYLPSVMTCVNYLKLPDYSTAQVMRDKLTKAMCDGQLSFHLS